MPHNRRLGFAETFSIPQLERKESFSTATGDYTHNHLVMSVTAIVRQS